MSEATIRQIPDLQALFDLFNQDRFLVTGRHLTAESDRYGRFPLLTPRHVVRGAQHTIAVLMMAMCRTGQKPAKERGIAYTTANRYIRLRQRYPHINQVGEFDSVSAALTRGRSAPIW